MHRYGTSILELGFETGIELIQEAYKKQLDERLWQRWLVDYTRMDKDNFIGFNDYKKQMLEPVKKKPLSKPKEEIFAQADKIIAAWNKEHRR